MNATEFQEVFDYLVSQSRKVLVEKAAQYADDNDRMHNFKRAAAFMGCTPEQALWGFLVKHLVSIQDMVQKEEAYPDEVWDEKIGGALNYLILLRGLIVEKESDPVLNNLSSSADPGDYHDLTIPPPTMGGNHRIIEE